MVALISFLLNVAASLFKSKSRLEAENAALRHQLIILRRKVRGRVRHTKGAAALVACTPPFAASRPTNEFFVFTVEKGPPEEMLTIFWS